MKDEELKYVSVSPELTTSESNIVHHDLAVHFNLVSEVGYPKESGDYVCICPGGIIWDIPYSNIHKLFNAIDESTTSHATRNAISVVAWAHIPDWVKEITE